jgi:hypothetical protein
MGESKRAADIFANEIRLRVPTRDLNLFFLLNNLAVFSMVRRLKMELFARSYITLGVIYGDKDED